MFPAATGTFWAGPRIGGNWGASGLVARPKEETREEENNDCDRNQNQENRRGSFFCPICTFAKFRDIFKVLVKQLACCVELVGQFINFQRLRLNGCFRLGDLLGQCVKPLILFIRIISNGLFQFLERTFVIFQFLLDDCSNLLLLFWSQPDAKRGIRVKKAGEETDESNVCFHVSVRVVGR